MTGKNRCAKDDPRRFDVTTPKQGVSAYVRLVNPAGQEVGALTSDRIIQDTNKVMASCVAILFARGVVVHGIATRNGHRWSASGKNWGGRRVKSQPQPGRWYHPDAVAIQAVVDAQSASRAAASALLHAGGGGGGGGHG